MSYRLRTRLPSSDSQAVEPEHAGPRCGDYRRCEHQEGDTSPSWTGVHGGERRGGRHADVDSPPGEPRTELISFGSRPSTSMC